MRQALVKFSGKSEAFWIAAGPGAYRTLRAQVATKFGINEQMLRLSSGLSLLTTDEEALEVVGGAKSDDNNNDCVIRAWVPLLGGGCGKSMLSKKSQDPKHSDDMVIAPSEHLPSGTNVAATDNSPAGHSSPNGSHQHQHQHDQLQHQHQPLLSRQSDLPCSPLEPKIDGKYLEEDALQLDTSPVSSKPTIVMAENCFDNIKNNNNNNNNNNEPATVRVTASTNSIVVDEGVIMTSSENFDGNGLKGNGSGKDGTDEDAWLRIETVPVEDMNRNIINTTDADINGNKMTNVDYQNHSNNIQNSHPNKDNSNNNNNNVHDKQHFVLEIEKAVKEHELEMATDEVNTHELEAINNNNNNNDNNDNSIDNNNINSADEAVEVTDGKSDTARLVEEVLNYAFEGVCPGNPFGKGRWLKKNYSQARKRFELVLEHIMSDPFIFDNWVCENGRSRLALVYLLEQYSHHLSLGNGNDFISEETAREVVLETLDEIKYLEDLNVIEQCCLMLPLLRSSSRKMQALWDEMWRGTIVVSHEKGPFAKDDLSFITSGDYLYDGLDHDESASNSEPSSPNHHGHHYASDSSDDEHDVPHHHHHHHHQQHQNPDDAAVPANLKPMKFRRSRPGAIVVLTSGVDHKHPLTPVREGSRESTPRFSLSPSVDGDLSPPLLALKPSSSLRFRLEAARNSTGSPRQQASPRVQGSPPSAANMQQPMSPLSLSPTLASSSPRA